MAVIEITLGADPSTGEGGVTVPVYPQRHAYLTSRLGKFLGELVESGQVLSADNDRGDLMGLLDLAGGQAYALLTALIPNLSKRLPEWEFRGFPTREAMETGEYDPALDQTSPSVPEIRAAIKIASDVCGLDILTHVKGLFGLVDPTLLRSIVSEKLLDLIDSTTSPSSPSATGELRSTSSGTTAPTSTGNEDSQSLASVA